jgi:tRNA(Ile)-lysidine synthase
MRRSADTVFRKVNRFVKDHRLLGGASGIVVAVSSGVDSVVLLEVLVRLVAKPRSSNPIANLHVAHLDHMLRGLESTKDAEFVRALAGRLNLPVTIESQDVRAAAKASRRGIEEVARAVRYRFLLDVARETGCDRIAVGHTMSDQTETFLMRLIRGAGLRGLTAMRPLVPAHTFSKIEKAEGGRQKAESVEVPSASCLLPSVFLIRPLLCVAREEVEAYCREHRLEFRTDVSNESLDYTRNRVRHEVLPALKKINPRVVEAIARATEVIGADQEILDRLASSALKQARTSSRDGGKSFSVAALLEQPPAMRRRMIIEAIRSSRTLLSGHDSSEITSTHVAAVESLLEPTSSGKHITLPARLEAWREFDALHFKGHRRVRHDATYEFSVSLTSPSVEVGGFSVTLERRLDGVLLNTIIEETKREKQKSGRDWMIVALDDLALPEKLLIRPRRQGESARIKGQRRIKKMKSLMIDHKIPAGHRDDWPLVTTPEGRYVWSPGLPPALEFAASDQTKRLAVLRASEISN